MQDFEMALLLKCLSKTVVCKFLKTSLELRFKQFLFDDQDYLYYRCAHDFSPQMIHFTIFHAATLIAFLYWNQRMVKSGWRRDIEIGPVFWKKLCCFFQELRSIHFFFKEKFLFRLFTKTPFSRDFYCAALFELVNNRSLTCGCESSSILFCSKKVKHQKNKRFLNGVFLERQSMPITASYKQVMNFIQRGPFFKDF